MSVNGLKVIFGGAAFILSSVEEVNAWLKVIEELGITTIDTAEGYGGSEEALGKAGAASKFIIDTKHTGGFGSQLSSKTNVIESGRTSLEKLKVSDLDVYYIHSPDRRVPWEDTLSGLNKLYQEGIFKRLGLSNFLAHEVEEIVRVATVNNFVIPSVYQGNYSAIARRTEDEILPVLRKHNISFYAYSPIAGGFLAKCKAELNSPEGRFHKAHPLAKIYNGMYNRSSLVAALDVWEQIAKDQGVTRAELAYRWIVYHSQLRGELGDAIIIGARKEQQLRETAKAMRNGPLSDGIVKRIGEVWEIVKSEAFLDNFEMMSKW
ncbi:hypothetical protein QQS21_009111 [Conoideocrella luteorostrata]|uniref:NADP-dependent oxidoreductase domain-containing protein n=1 Tax=Conoideocrella luteorostrata TaxID=1105319 RepID=A0AAJ0CKA0_9HYPO|nr:hypothetical protein QQS21_009111 [Conoideocrella luteorostrata]